MQKGFKINRFILYGGLLVVGLFAFMFGKAQPTEAATGINQTINFQGRLLNSQGATVPDGFYNIQFKIYQDGDGQSVGNTTGSPSGSLKWTESHLNNNSQGVKVVNGYLSVQLGAVSAFGSNIDWNQDTLWLSMNVGSTNGSCTPFSSCSPDGEMVPMQPMTSSPYAMNAGQLGGIASSGFVQLAQGLQTDASSATSIYINKTGSGNIIDLQSGGSSVFTISNSGDVLSKRTSTTAFQIQNASSANTFTADTSNQRVTIGNSASSSTLTVNGQSNTSLLILTPGTGASSDSAYININSGRTFFGYDGSTDRAVVRGGTSKGVNIITNDSTVAANFASNGSVIFKNGTDSATAFQIQNSGGTSNLFTVDTQNTKIGIGAAPTTTGSILQITGSALVSSTIQSNAGFISGSSLTSSYYSKTYTAGTGGVNANDVVIVDNDSGNARALQTTVARDNRVAGVAVSAAASGAITPVVFAGAFQVTADTGAVAIGDRLVTSTTAGQVMVDNNATTGIVGTALSTKSSGSSGLVSIAVRPVNGQYSPVFMNASNSTSAFQIQKSSASDTLFTADTTNNKLVVGNATGTDANTTLLVLDSATADPATGYNGAQYYNTTSNKFRCYQNGGWTDCITTAIGSIGTYSSANHYSDGATISGNSLILGSADATHPGLVDSSAQTFAGNKTFTGDLLVKENSTTAFAIQNTSSQNLMVADTSNSKVAIGPAAAAANSVLTIGTSTTSASGGITFGADTSATLYRSAAAELTTGATLNVAALQSSGDISFTSTSAIAGAITKTFITDTNGVNQFDVVIMSSTPDIETTTAARDNRVFGVSQSTIASGGTGNARVVTSGNYRVNVDLPAVAIGDQLVTSTTAGRATVDNNATTGIIGTALSSKSAGANGTVSVYVHPVKGQYTPTFRGSGNSTTAFQVQNSGGNNFLAIDTSGNIVNLGITGSTNVSSTIHIADSSAGVQTVVVGSTNSSSTTTIQAGTNGIHLDGNTSVEGSHSFATGTGTVNLNGDTTVASGKNFTQSGGGTFSTGSGTNSLNGNTTVATGKTFTVTDGNSTLGGNLDLTGSAAFKKGADFSTAGTTNDASFANASLVRLSGGSAQTITGIQNGRDGYILTIVNGGAVAATLTNEDTNSTAINRITTGGGNLSLPVGSSITLVYDSNGQRWRTSAVASLQSAYNNSSSPQITLDSTRGGLVVQDASSAIGADLFTVQSNGAGTKYLNVTSSTVSVNDTLAVTGNITASGTYNTNTFNSTALQFGGSSGTISTSSGNLAVQANGTSTLSLDTTGAGTVGIATSNATTVSIATNNIAHTINIGTGGTSTNQTIAIGSNFTTGGSVTLNGGSTGGVHFNGPTVVDGANTFTTGTGAVSLNGDTTIASGKNFTQSGAGTFSTGTGTNTLNGDTSIASGKSFTANGTALFKTSSATAFQVQNSNSRNVLAIDTTTNVLTVGNTTDGSVIALGANGNANAAITKSMAVTGAVSANDLVQVDTANDGKVKLAVANSSLVFGIATAAASSANVDVVISGVYQVSADATALAPGDLLVSSSTAGKVTKAGSTVASGTVLGRALSTKGAGAGLVWVTLTLGVGGSDSLQTAYNNSTGGATPEIKLDSTRGALNVQDADTTISGSLFTVTGSSGGSLGTLFDVQSTGATLIGSTSQTATITLGQSTDSNTINIGSNNSLASGKTQTINIGTSTGTGTTTNVSIGSTIAGTTTINGGTGVSITGDTTISSGKNFTQSGGGTFSTGTGTVSLNGDTTIASGKNFTQSGGGTFSTGTGTNTHNGDTIIASGKTFTANGTALFKASSSSATAFQVQNTSSRNILNVDTSGNILAVGNNTDGANLTLNATGNASAAVRKSMVVTGTIAANDLVEIDTSNAGQVQQAVASSTKVFGIASSAVGSGSAQDIVISGVFQVNANTSGGTPAIGDTLVSSTTAGQVTKTGTTTASGSVVGLALSTISGGKIWVFVNLGLGGSDNLQTVYNKSTGSTTPEIKVDSTRGGVDIQDADSTISGSLLTVRASNGSGLGTALFDVQSTGAINVGSTSQTATINVGQSTDTNTIAIGNAATASGKTQTVNIGANGASGSTTNISIGSTVAGTTTINGATGISLTGVTTVSNGKTLVLGSNSGTGGLTCTNGAIFYDSSANRFKGCESSAWVTLDNYADLQTYTASGSWTKLANVTTVQVIMVGGGGGGGGAGARNGGQERNGGGGGGGGSYVSQVFAASDLASGNVTVGSAGSTGAGAASSGSAGTSGGGGGASCFSSGSSCSGTIYAQAFGGGGGGGGNQAGTAGGAGGGGGGAGAVGSTPANNTNTAGAGGGPAGGAANASTAGGAGAGGGSANSGAGTAGNAGGAAEYGGAGGGGAAGGNATSGNGGSSVHGAGGGGAGGSTNSGNATGNPGAGGVSQSITSGGGGAVGTSGCTGGGNGGSGTSIKAGSGGGGGGANGGGGSAGCNGGNGGQPGGGGGGGGSGSTSGGTGGSGGSGEVWVISW